MNYQDAKIAMRALNLDGGEGSGVKGHTTEHALHLTGGKLGQSEYDRLVTLTRQKGLSLEHLHTQLKVQGIKLHPNTMVQVESKNTVLSNNVAGRLGVDSRGRTSGRVSSHVLNMVEVSRRLREGDF